MNKKQKQERVTEDFYQNVDQAEYSVELGFTSLIHLAKQGDHQALSSLLSIARDAASFLVGRSLHGEALKNLDKLQRNSTVWPVCLSCEHADHEGEITSFKQLPLGEDLAIKHNKIGKQGRPIDWSPEGNADVALSLVNFIHGVRRGITQEKYVSPELLITEKKYKRLASNSSDITPEEMKLQCKLISLRDDAVNQNSPTIDDWATYYDLPVDLTLRIKNLPDFTKPNLKEWSEVACKLALDLDQQDRWIPSVWRQNYKNQAHPDQKGFGAYCRWGIKSAVKSMIPAGN